MAQVVKVLIVTDGGGGYKHSQLDSGGSHINKFHLGEFINVLQTTTWRGFTLQIVKAHRENVDAADINADLVNFRFDTHDLSAYDEILLFPIRRNDEGVDATDAEVRAIAEFMDAGGGVFATGDHENLGAALCARLPRIRNMRRWYWNAPGPNGEPVAPDGGTATRHDTLRAGHDYNPATPNSNYQFDDESDNIAQTIIPAIFETRSSRYVRQTWPHPLLCSPEGIIRYLPDHPHEGECEVPANLGLNITASGYNKPEYPPLADGTTLKPVVVARATVIGGHETSGKPAVNPDTFGVIGAYDGHQVRRDGKRLGRVVVDATWHHFFNINLTGSLNSGTPAKRQGFYAPLLPGQQDHYKMIKHYYRNIIYWLIPAHRQVWRFQNLIAKMVIDPEFYELNPISHIRDFNRLELSHIIALGKLADAYFNQAHGACWKLQLLPVIFYEFDPFRRIWEKFEPFVNPWIDKSLKNTRIPAGFDGEQFVDTILGSTVLAAVQVQQHLARENKELKDDELDRHTFALFEKILPDNLSIGLDRIGRKFQNEAEQLTHLATEFEPFVARKNQCN